MKIAVIGSKGLPPHQGGIEHHCAEIYSRIVAKGHGVTVFARSSYNQLPWNARYLYKGVQVKNLPSIPLRGIDALVNSFLAAIIASFQQSDIIHFHALGPAVFCWIPRLLSPKSKVVVTCHGLDWQRSKWGNFSTRLLKLGEQFSVRFSHAIGVVSADLQKYFDSVYNRQTTYIGNAPASYPESDPDFAFGRSKGLDSGRYMLFLGRLVPEKCPDLLIGAFQKLLPTGWKLALVGGQSDTTTYSDKLLSLADSNPDILFCGELRGKQLAEIVRGAGLFILPSEVEGLPLALLEAMQEGIPVVASDIPVHRQLLGLDRGLLFKGGSVEACSAALMWAIQNLPSMQQRSDKAQEYIRQNHNWDDIVGAWLELYEKQLGYAPVSSVPVSSIPTTEPPVALSKRS